MKKIEITPILQDENSVDCGPTCVKMVLDHFGIYKDIESLRSLLGYTEEGTSAYDKGALLLTENLNVTVVTAHPRLFTPDDIANIHLKQDIESVIDKVSMEEPKSKCVLDTFKNFLSKGGKFSLEIPTFKHIKKAIDADCLVIALLYARALGSNEGGYHFVVVNGYDDDENVFITNPLPNSKKQSWFPSNEFIFGLHVSTMVDVDNGSLLIVSK